jgi:hypothetical protein
MGLFQKVVCAALIAAAALLGTSSTLLAVPFCPRGYHWAWTGGYYWNGHSWTPRYACMPFGWEPGWFSSLGKPS